MEEYSKSNAPRAEYVTMNLESNIYTRCFSNGKTRSFVALPKDKKEPQKPPAPGSEKQEP